MDTKEFLNRFDNKDSFTSDELYRLWIGDVDINYTLEEDEQWGEPDRWNTCVTKVIKIEDRYFMIYAWKGNTEMQEDYYDIQPDEVKPVEKTVIVWEEI